MIGKGMNTNNDSGERKLVEDIRRTIILSAYMHYWGLPEYRFSSSRGNETVEIYSFPPSAEETIHHFGTVGISGFKRVDGELANYELMLVLPRSLGGAAWEKVSSFMMDVVAYSLELQSPFQEGTLIPETPLVPETWGPKAILIDTPRAEPEELSCFYVGNQQIDLLWLVPIYGDEYALIKNDGLEAFDRSCEQSDFSLADINRASFASAK